MTFEDGEVSLTERTATTWSYPDENGDLVEFNDVFAYQTYHAQFSPVVHTTSVKTTGRRMKAEF